MRVSIIVRSRDEAPRLRLTLASLIGQGAEVVVVDDGSADATPAVIAEAARAMPLTVVTHAAPAGRAGAANAGARAASGALLLFLDGDTLAGSGIAAAHARAHRAAGRAIAGRGETWHLRHVRDLADPEAGTPWTGKPPPLLADRARGRLTRAEVIDGFASIAARATPGIYPGAAPRRLHALEMAALRDDPGGALNWAAASGSNFSVRRADFLAVGGFDPAIDINEHRELALRLTRHGVRLAAVEGARTYHMIHRRGWRDPLVETGWEVAFRAAHPDAPLDLLKRFWAGVADGDGEPPSLSALAREGPA